MKSSSMFFLTAMAVYSTVACPPDVLAENRRLTQVVNQIKWRLYWLGGTTETPDVTAEYSLLFNDGYAGYCSKSWRVCELFRVIHEEPSIALAERKPFDSEKAAGVWDDVRPAAGSSSAVVVPDVARSGSKISVNGIVIEDPLTSNPAEVDQTTKRRIVLRSCQLDKSGLGTILPDSISRHLRPLLADSLISAIRAQKVLKAARWVVVPFFDDRDQDVFVGLVRAAGDCEVIEAHNLGRGDWAFYPATSIRSGRERVMTCAKIKQSSMVTLSVDAGEVWRRW